MKWLIGTLLRWYYLGLSIFHIMQTLIIRGVVRLFDMLFGTDVYNQKTRICIHRMHLAIWIKLRDVHKKYFPGNVEELNEIEKEIMSIQEEL